MPQRVVIRFVRGGGHIVFVHQRITFEIFYGKKGVGHQVRQLYARIQTVVIHVSVFLKPFRGNIIEKHRGIQVHMTDLPRADVDEKLRILSPLVGGGIVVGVVNRFVQQKGNQVRRMCILVAVNNGITQGGMQSPHGLKGEQVGGNVFFPVHPAVAGAIGIGIGVGTYRIHHA